MIKQKIKIVFLFLCLVFFNQHLFSQENLDSLIIVNDTTGNLIVPLVDTVINIEELKTDVYPIFSDEIYTQRLKEIKSEIPLTYNQHVKNFIHLYLLRRREQVGRMVGLSEYYFPVFEEVLFQNKMPLSLKYLAVVESALNPNAISRAGAAGMWQFMYATGKIYKLRVSPFIDERRDPYKATDAAAKYLKDLYNIYDDWILAIAAYNCGPGNVNKAIRLSKGNRDYWQILKYLPKETRGYVPAFIAAAYVMNYYPLHNIASEFPPYLLQELDTIHVYDHIHFDHLAKYLEMPVEEIAYYNPSVKKNFVPKMDTSFPIYLPCGKLDFFCMNLDSIYLKSLEDSASAAMLAYQSHFKDGYYPGTENKKRIIYTVKKGNNISYIASRYNCRVQDVRNWNNLKSNKIYIGQKLKIYTHITQQSVTTKTANTNSTQSDGQYNYYIVKNGDTLWGIANQFSGVTIEKIKELNNITEHKKIQPGQKLKISLVK